MEKDKIILKDGTELEINQGGNTGMAVISFNSLEEFVLTAKKLTPANLEQYQLLNHAGLVAANPENKECRSVGLDLTWDDASKITAVKAAFQIADVDMVAKAIKELQAGQEVQDGAITELADVIGGAE